MTRPSRRVERGDPVTRLSRRQLVQGSLAFAGLSLLSGCGMLPSQSQQAANIPRIGYLAFGRSGPDEQDEAFRQGLGELGYREGGNLAIEWRFTDQAGLLPDLAAELVRLPVNLIVAAGGAVNTAKDATTTIPIVAPVTGDPVRQGLVSSLARPGGNITGLSTLSSEIAGKRLQLLKEIAPQASQVAVLWNPGNPAKGLEFQETQVAARSLGLTLQSFEVRGPHDFTSAFDAAASRHVDALVTLTESLTLTHAAEIAGFALNSRLPSMSELRPFVAAGGLVSYGPNVPDVYRRAAAYVDKILKGAKPADLPVEQPMRFDFVVNMNTAQALGISFPPEILLQITEVIP
jgi:putative tryptophan/tyrosine transport system substrate-binding protein